MAAVELTISGVLYDKVARTMQQVVLVGEASLTGLGVGGGPMPPGPGDPVHIWGGGNVPMPNPPIANVPGAPGYRPPEPPVSVPPPGSPPVIMPGAHPSHPMVPPAAIIVDYPGIGNVMVPKPLPAA